MLAEAQSLISEKERLIINIDIHISRIKNAVEIKSYYLIPNNSQVDLVRESCR